MIQEAAPAKINLFLHVGARRADGFHPLQSLAVFAQAGDVLEIAAAPDLSLRIAGPFARGLDGEGDNLVLRAARSLLGKSANGGAAMTLTKNLPVSSGIGGGSADAAAALRGLSRLWQVEGADLSDIGARLGSDIPVCVAARPAFMEGRGEILHAVDGMPRIALLLVNPGIAVPTKAVFAALETRSGVDMVLPRDGLGDVAGILQFLEKTRNDLEAPARILQPVIGTVLDAIASRPGVMITRMSGSGATCFGLFTDDESCAGAAVSLRMENPHWWVAPTVICAA